MDMDINEAISIAFEEAKEMGDNGHGYINHEDVDDEAIEEWCENQGYTITGSGYGFGERDLSVEFEDEDGETIMISLVYTGLPKFRM